MAVRVGVVGHVEWVTHATGRIPERGQIAHLDGAFDEPAGGGGVTAAQVARLGVDCRFYTAVGEDEAGDLSVRELSRHGVRVLAATRRARQPRGLSVADPSGERTILITGGRLSPTVDDRLPWRDLARCEAAFFTGDDPRTITAARAARHLVVTARRLESLAKSRVRADVLVASATDEDELFHPAELPVAPRAIVLTEGSAGGRIVVAGRERRYQAAAPPGPLVDTYGAGDSFAAGLTVGLALGWRLDLAVALGARCGASALTRRGGLGDPDDQSDLVEQAAASGAAGA